MIRGLAEKLGLTEQSPHGESGAREHALARARGSRDSRVRPVQPTGRQIVRRQQRTAATDARKRRRRMFLAAQQQERTEQTLRTWARVYLDGAGSDDVRRNVAAAVHRQAEVYSKAHGEPVATSLKRVEGLLLEASAGRGRSR